MTPHHHQRKNSTASSQPIEIQRQISLNILNEQRSVVIWRYTLNRYWKKCWRISYYFILWPLILSAVWLYFQRPDFANYLHLQATKIINFNPDSFRDRRINLEIDGNIYTDYNQIMEIVGSVLNGMNQLNSFSVLSELKNELLRLPWVSDVEIYKTLTLYTNEIKVTLHEHTPEFLWLNQNNLTVVAKGGEVITQFDPNDFRGMVVVVADHLNSQLFNLWDLVNLNEQLFPLLEQIVMVWDQRFDLVLRNGITIKLPAENYQSALGFISQSLENDGFLSGLKTLDLRLENKAFLEYDTQTINAIRSIPLAN